MIGVFTHEGFSQEDLLAIGTRRSSLGSKDMSATDINATIPFLVSEAARAHMDGYDEKLLKDIGERKISMPSMSASEVNQARLDNSKAGAAEDILSKLQSFLGIRTK